MLRSFLIQDSLDILVAERPSFEGVSFHRSFRESYFFHRKYVPARIAFFYAVQGELNFTRRPLYDGGPTLAEWEAHRPLGNVVHE